MDGVHPLHNSINTRGWIKKAKEQAIEANTGRQRLNLNGACNAELEMSFIHESESVNAQSTIVYHPKVPPDNNSSEQAIRNAKIKMKISNQFKTINEANYFAILRSVIDTAIKSNQNVLNAFNNLAYNTAE